MLRIVQNLIFIFIFLLSLVGHALAQPKYTIKPAYSKIEGKISYSLIGHYQAQFTDFSGEVAFDPKDLAHSSVLLKIHAASIKSKFPALDRVVRSSRLLHTQKYPWIIFKSQSIQESNGQYFVTGIVDIHGIKRPITFPFVVENQFKAGNLSLLKAKGKFKVNRKEFDIIWHEVLDKGGIIVGNDITVDWAVEAEK
jgi:polyisoprenoid-binding protein YceI